MNYIAAMQDFHREAIEPYLGAPQGCSDADIARLETRIGESLPEAYRQWLLWMGRDTNGILRGTNCFFSDATTDTSELSDLNGWDFGAFPIPDHALIVYSHQGYVVAWFLLPARDAAPIVYCFSEGKGLTTPVVAGTFTEFLLEDLTGMAPVLPQLRRRDW